MTLSEFDIELIKLNDLIINISELAKKTHADTNHTLTIVVNGFAVKLPYAEHLDKTFSIFKQFGYSSIEKPEDLLPICFAIYFHDTIEDARLTYSKIVRLASDYMSSEQATLAADIVFAVTNDKGKTREDRENPKYFELIHETPYASLVKCCDRAANISFAWEHMDRSRFKMYKKEMEYFLKMITSYSNPELVTETTTAPDELIKFLNDLTELPA